jgi:hypothetical protein
MSSQLRRKRIARQRSDEANRIARRADDDDDD